MKIELKSDRLLLRKLKPSDAEALYRGFRDKDVLRWINRNKPYERNDAVKFISRSNYHWRKKKAFIFGIILKETNTLIGDVGIRNIKDKTASVGYWLSKEYWGKGIMTEALKLVLEFGFKKLKLHRIYGDCFEKNIGSHKVLTKAGFKLEGVERKSRFKKGKWHNVNLYGILESDFKNN